VTGAERIDPSNVAQLGEWDGAKGAFWVDHADWLERGVAGYQGPLLAAAAIEEAATVLDLGCGTGQLSRDAARRATAGSVLGVDLSPAMLELARRRTASEGLANVSYERADAQLYPFPPQRFDLAVSRNGVMFFGDPVAAFRNIARALRPGGRLVALTWQPFERNEFMSAALTALSVGRDVPVPPSDAPGPLALSDPDRVRALLGAAGFTDVRLDGFVEPMYQGDDPADAFAHICDQRAELIRGLEPDARVGALERLRASLAEHHTEHGVFYDSAAWVVQARV
jgi:SAM-dependent methyltransferase